MLKLPSSTLRARPPAAGPVFCPQAAAVAAALPPVETFFFCCPALCGQRSPRLRFRRSSKAKAASAPPLPARADDSREIRSQHSSPAHIHSFRAFRRPCPAVNPRLFDCATPEHHARTYPQPCRRRVRFRTTSPSLRTTHHRYICCLRTASARSPPIRPPRPPRPTFRPRTIRPARVSVRIILHGRCGATSRSPQVNTSRRKDAPCQYVALRPKKPPLPEPQPGAATNLTLLTAFSARAQRCAVPELTLRDPLRRLSCMYTFSTAPP